MSVDIITPVHIVTTNKFISNSWKKLLSKITYVSDELVNIQSSTSASTSSSSLPTISSSSSSSSPSAAMETSEASTTSYSIPNALLNSKLFSINLLNLDSYRVDDYNNKNDVVYGEEDQSLSMCISLLLNKSESILHLPENLTKCYNYSDWDNFHKLIYKHADINLVTYIQVWHGMKIMGRDMYIRYQMIFIEANPDAMRMIEEVKTIQNVIEVKSSFSYTDCYAIHEHMFNNNHSNDNMIANTTCARRLRLLPQMNLTNKSSDEVKVMLDLLESKHDLFVKGIDFTRYIIDQKTRKLVELRIDYHIISIRVIPKL